MHRLLGCRFDFQSRLFRDTARFVIVIALPTIVNYRQYLPLNAVFAGDGVSSDCAELDADTVRGPD